MESIPGYDEWKTATPWDDEVDVTLDFECEVCEESVTAQGMAGKRDSEVYLECPACGEENTVERY